MTEYVGDLRKRSWSWAEYILLDGSSNFILSMSGGAGREVVAGAGRGFSGGSRRFHGVSFGRTFERFGTSEGETAGTRSGSLCVDSTEGMTSGLPAYMVVNAFNC